MFASLAGCAVVVTGATRGIGKGIAGVFATSGARVLVVGRDEDAAKAAVAELSADGAEVSYVLADVSERAGCERIAATAAERLGGIDIVPDSLTYNPGLELLVSHLWPLWHEFLLFPGAQHVSVTSLAPVYRHLAMLPD
jgi:NADP-dependent 3-hydroxy acid dehydrogenase YdfG